MALQREHCHHSLPRATLCLENSFWHECRMENSFWHGYRSGFQATPLLRPVLIPCPCQPTPAVYARLGQAMRARLQEPPFLLLCCHQSISPPSARKSWSSELASWSIALPHIHEQLPALFSFTVFVKQKRWAAFHRGMQLLQCTRSNYGIIIRHCNYFQGRGPAFLGTALEQQKSQICHCHGVRIAALMTSHCKHSHSTPTPQRILN